MIDWIYDLMIEERTSAWTSRDEVRAKVDEALAETAPKITPIVSRRTEDDVEAEREARINDPKNEQAAASLMAVAAGARRR